MLGRARRGRCLPCAKHRPPSQGWASPKRFALPLRLTGQLGQMRSLSSPHTQPLPSAADGRSLLGLRLERAPPPGTSSRAEDDADIELDEWRHGWQGRASRTRNLFFRDRAVALNASGLPCDAALASWPACACLADGHPERPSHVARPGRHADSTPPQATAPASAGAGHLW